MATDKSLWYGHKQVESQVFQNLKGSKNVAPLRCETKLPKLIHRIQEYDAQNPNSNKSLAIPFLYERGANGNRNHFFTIFREKDTSGNFKYIVQDSNGDQAPQTLIDALKKATPGAIVESWDKKQQTNGHDCGPHTIENLKEMAAAKEKHPNTPLAPGVISTKRDMTAIRKQHGFKLSNEESITPDSPEENRNQAQATGGAASADGTVTDKQMWDSVKDFGKKLLDPTKTTFISGVLGLGFDALLWVMTKEPKKKVTPLPVPEDEPAAPEKSGGSGRVLEGTAKRLAEQVKKLPLGLENAKEVGSPESHTAKVGTSSSKSNNQVSTGRS